MRTIALLHLLMCSSISLFSQELSQHHQNTSQTPTKILDHFEHYSWDKDKEVWRKVASTDYLYDDNFNNTKELEYNNDDYLSNVSIYRFDNNNNIIEYRTQSPNSTTSIVEEYQYDEKQNRTKKVRYYLDLTTKEKSYNPSTLFSYYDNGLLKEEIVDKSQKYEHTYNEEKEKTETLKYNWIKSDQTYKPTLKSIYTYDDHNNITYYSDYKIDRITGEQSKEAHSLKYEYTYENDRVVKIIASILDNKVLFWKDYRETRYEYDQSGNLTRRTFYNFENFKPIPSSRYEYSYDLSVEKENIITPVSDVYGIKKSIYSDTSHFINQPNSCTIYNWDEKTDSWTPYLLYNFGYSTEEITSASKENLKMQIYPNPTTDKLNFSIPESQNDVYFELTDLNGNILFSETIKHMHQISLEKLTSGIYFYRISNKTLHQSGKIIKK